MQEEKEPEKWLENEQQHTAPKERQNINIKLIINEVQLREHGLFPVPGTRFRRA